MSRRPTSGGGVRGEYLLITDNDYASNAVNFPSPGRYRFTVRAKGKAARGVDAKMEIRVDRVAQGAVYVGTIAADYSLEIDIATEGTHEVGLAFVNDMYDSVTREDRNLYLDRLTIWYP